MNTLLAQRLYLIDFSKGCCTCIDLNIVGSGKSSQTLRIPSPSQFLKKDISEALQYIFDFFKCHHMISKRI